MSDNSRIEEPSVAPREIPCRGGHTAELYEDAAKGRRACEDELLERGVSLPLSHRTAWTSADPTADSWFLAVRDGDGRCVCGFALQVTRSRVLAGHLLLRVEKFGAALTGESRTAALEALVKLSHSHKRVLRVYLEVFSRDARIREQVESDANGLGFRRPAARRMYADTVIVDLARDDAAMLARLGQKTRKNIRDVAAGPLEVRVITDVGYVDRMNALMRETMARTGGRPEDQDWAAILRFANSYPSLGRVVGTVRTDIATPDALVAFSWGRSHGDHVEICNTASTRIPGSKVALTYALVWNLMCWGGSIGATWLDLGGVTAGVSGSADPLGGISDFKRAFSKTVVRVGDEWVYEPRRFRALIASLAGRVWSRVTGR